MFPGLLLAVWHTRITRRVEIKMSLVVKTYHFSRSSLTAIEMVPYSKDQLDEMRTITILGFHFKCLDPVRFYFHSVVDDKKIIYCTPENLGLIIQGHLNNGRNCWFVHRLNVAMPGGVTGNLKLRINIDSDAKFKEEISKNWTVRNPICLDPEIELIEQFLAIE